MTYKGHVKNGVVVLDEPAQLKEGMAVRIEPLEGGDEDFESLREGLLSVAGSIEGLPEDMARNHDHYIHGAPRK